jgi:hypothetical protein
LEEGSGGGGVAVVGPAAVDDLADGDGLGDVGCSCEAVVASGGTAAGWGDLSDVVSVEMGEEHEVEMVRRDADELPGDVAGDPFSGVAGGVGAGRR